MMQHFTYAYFGPVLSSSYIRSSFMKIKSPERQVHLRLQSRLTRNQDDCAHYVNRAIYVSSLSIYILLPYTSNSSSSG